MTKYFYTCEEDKNLIMRSFNNIAFIIFGKNNSKKIDAFDNYFEKKVSQVSIYPQGTVTDKINNSTPGICRADKNGNIIIEMLGYNGATRNKHSWIKHEGTHEFCHSFVNLLPTIFSKNPNGIIKNGILCKCHMGMIQETDSKTRIPVGQHYYGKMFNETMMDIITSMAINCFDSEHKTSSIDNILKINYNEWGNETTGYSIFTSITRLAIAAFSNNGFINYQNIVNSGYGIFDIKTKMKNGEILMANDFLYGIVYDHLHIEEEFDKFMGQGYYRTFCEFLDRLFIMSLKRQQLPSEEVKRVMNIFPDFLNKKMNYYLQNGIIDLEGQKRIVGNFNQIWNSMQKEYGSYFNQKDIDAIAKRAGKK